jgi:hypothetical protein
MAFIRHSYCTLREKSAYEKYDRKPIRAWPAAPADAFDAYYSFKRCWPGLSSAPAQTTSQTADAPGRPQCGSGKSAVTDSIGQYFP